MDPTYEHWLSSDQPGIAELSCYAPDNAWFDIATIYEALLYIFDLSLIRFCLTSGASFTGSQVLLFSLKPLNWLQ